MQAVIKSFEGMIDEPDDYVSEDPANDAFLLRMMIGPAHSPGIDAFDILVCTPGWLAQETEQKGPQLRRHMLVMATLDLTRAQDFLRRRVEQLTAPNWEDIARKLARIGHWELED
ncbi:Imm8 family immunity protein [uncultured Friedmanniella sp.]|uniref:Imm8 family immunity protein n=1 Tax=uncultured Friedmanniella sp. TaxID=335381 RepID=UPI0035CB2A75